jgi:YD repeat-containing protein
LKTGGAKYGSLVRRGSEIEVYIIENGLRRWIPDPNTLYAMGRTFNEVVSLEGVLFDRITRGDDIPSIDSSAGNFIVYVSEITANGASVYDSGVNVSNGSYVYQKDHLAVPGRGLPFEFSTSYNAMDSYSYTMGQGWIHSYDITATEVQKTPSGGSKTNVFMRAKWGNGQEEWYQWNGTAYSALYGGHNTVSGGSGASTLTITTKSQVKYAFELSSSVAAASQDSSGNSTTITTNSYRLKTITDKNGNTITLNYSGLLSSITDTVGRTISFAYTQMTDSSNTVITRLTKVTDPINRTVEFTYDTDGRVIKIKDLNDGFTQLAYNEKVMGMTNPLLKTVTDPRGNVIISAGYTDITGTSNINMSDYKKATSVKMGVDTPAAFSYSGNATTVTDSMSYQTTYTKDTSNRLTQLTDPLSKNLLLAYSDSSNPLAPSTITDRRSYQTKFTYDASGNVTKITDALNNSTNFEYDSMNNVTKKTDALGRVTTYTYDAKGNLTKVAAPIGTVNITVNQYGQPETVTDANGNATTYVYDSYGNLTEIREPLSRTTKFGYDTVGRKTAETDANNNVTSFTYDNNNNLLTVTHNATGKTITYQYDANGNRTSVTDENNNTTTYTYDERNRVTKVSNPEGNATNYAYDSLNRLTQTTDANNKVTKYEYDAVGGTSQRSPMRRTGL